MSAPLVAAPDLKPAFEPGRETRMLATSVATEYWTMLKGACNCGSIRFEADAQPAGVIVCHCSICRRHTGTNGNAVLLVNNSDFRWTQGEAQIRTWKKPGHDWQIWFCPDCGSQVPGRNDPLRMFLPAGLLTHGDEALEVIHHVWVNSRAGWDEIGDCGRQHAEAFAG